MIGVALAFLRPFLMPIAAGAAILFGGIAAWEAVQIHGLPLFGGGLKAEVASLRSEIDDPNTGYKIRLHDAERNVLDLRASLDEQSAAVRALGEAGAKAAADAAKAVGDARALGAAANRTVAAIMAARPMAVPGACMDSDVDRLILETIQ